MRLPVEVEQPKGELVCYGPSVKRGVFYRYTWAIVVNFFDCSVNLIVPHPDYDSMYVGVYDIRFRWDNRRRRWWQVLLCIKLPPTLDEALWMMEDQMDRFALVKDELKAHLEAREQLNAMFKI